MLNQITIWQMVIDLSLVSSILLMAFRVVKSSRINALLPQAAAMEARINKLMAETEAAAKHLNDQLLRREQNIHKYIKDLEKREKEFSLSIIEGESLSKELALISEGARRESEAIELAIQEANDAQRKLSSVGASARRSDQSNTRQQPEREEVRFTTRNRSRRASDWLDDEPEVVSATQEEVSKEKPSVKALQNLYFTAEEMLKDGHDAQVVSDQTKLPIAGVQRLAQMIEIEREESRDKRNSDRLSQKQDPRLGALGAFRRPSSTL